MRDQHFFASIDKAQAELGWTPKWVAQLRRVVCLLPPSGPGGGGGGARAGHCCVCVTQACGCHAFRFGLVDGLTDSYKKDFGLGQFRKVGGALA